MVARSGNSTWLIALAIDAKSSTAGEGGVTGNGLDSNETDSNAEDDDPDE